MVELTEEHARFARGTLVRGDRSVARHGSSHAARRWRPAVADAISSTPSPSLQLEMKERDGPRRAGAHRSAPTRRRWTPTTCRRAGIARRFGPASSTGRAGLRRRRSHDLVVPESCVVSHPLVEELLVEGRYDGCESVTIRVGARTGERLVIVKGPTAGVRVPDDVVVIDDAASAQGWRRDPRGGRRPTLPGARRARSSRADPTAPTRWSSSSARRSRVGSTRRRNGSSTSTPVSASSPGRSRRARSRRWNGPRARSATRGTTWPPGTRVLPIAVEKWRATPADVVVADPARDGLGAGVVAQIAASGATLVALGQLRRRAHWVATPPRSWVPATR